MHFMEESEFFSGEGREEVYEDWVKTQGNSNIVIFLFYFIF